MGRVAAAASTDAAGYWRLLSATIGGSLALLLTACAGNSSLPDGAGYGPKPTLPEPHRQFVPIVHIAPAKGWPEHQTPLAAAGYTVNAYAADLTHPRWLYVLPNGDVLVAETNAPERPEEGKGLKGWFMQKTMKRAGAGVPSANRITLLRDADGDGVAETRSPFIKDLNSPFGMTLVGDDLYVANTDAIMRYGYRSGATQIDGPGSKVFELPAGSINHHWTKNVIASPDGSRLYVTVGSNSNIAEHGMRNEERRAAILEFNLADKSSCVFASGLRNPNGMGWQPGSGELWTVVNERDEIGNDLVPDYLTAVRDGGFYGWPYSYYGQHVDDRAQPPRPELVAKALVPTYALGSHTASLGLAFYDGKLFDERYRNGAFIGQHGSWNRKPLSGYKVIFVPFSKGEPAGPVQDVLTGFVNERGEALGRPVGVAVDRRGAVLIADDVGNRIWRVTPAQQSRQATAVPVR
jgi:glucose/arabinose dehydrogenase